MQIWQFLMKKTKLPLHIFSSTFFAFQADSSRVGKCRRFQAHCGVRFILFLFSSTFFLLPFGFPVLVPFCPTTFFYFIFLPPRCRYYFLLFCFYSTALHSTLCFSVCVYQWCVSITELGLNLFMLKCLTCRSVLGLCVSV